MSMSDNYEWWQYFLIPWIAGFVGYFTNVLALHMTFYPIEFVGIDVWRFKEEPFGLFGWQGIVPSKARKMANICFELFTTKLFSIQEIFQRLDPVRISLAMEDSMLLMMDEVINEVAMEYFPDAWDSLPDEVKDDIIVFTNNETDTLVARVMKDVIEHVEQVVDIKQLTVEACVANKNLCVKIFQECGDQEFVFIRRSGFYFGFLFGLGQMTFWFFYQGSWILPVAGFLVGWVTNYVALKIIFRPLEPHSIFGWNLHGLFLKRQKEVSEVFARVIMTEILTVETIWDGILTGPLSPNFYAILRANTLVFIDRKFADIKPLVVATLGAKKYDQMTEDIVSKVANDLPLIIKDSYQYTHQAMDMETSVRERMQELSPSEFEGVLHPAFEEDEIELIALGGLLGGIVGGIQLVTLFR